MSGVVGEIRERSSEDALPPAPPSFADQRASGFPPIKHRSRVSAFKRARTQGVTASSSSQDAPAVISSTPVESRLAPQRPSMSAATASAAMDTQQILQQIQSENEARIAGLSSTERETELKELQEMFGSDLLQRLKIRAAKKQVAVLKEETPAGGSVSTEEPVRAIAETEEKEEMQAAVALEMPSQKNGKNKVRFVNPTNPVNPSADPLSPQAIHDRYFPDQPINLPGLEWMQPPKAGSSSSTLADIRFDLSGNPLSEKDVADLPASLGLHHHGNDPYSAGYTAEEILHLATSTFGPQRTIMLLLLSKITSQLDSYPVQIAQALIQGDLVGKTANLGVSILCSNERNIGIVREGISCLHAAINASRDKAKQSPSLPLDSLLPRIERLLEEPMKSSSLAPPSIQKLIAFLQSVADDSAAQAEEVTSILPTLVESLIIGCSWPGQEGTSTQAELTVAASTLCLLYTCTISHRDNAQTLLRKGVYAELLRFIAVPPWLWTSNGDNLGLALRCTALSMNIIEAVNRYGLYGSVVMTLTEAIQDVGSWIGRQTSDTPLSTPPMVIYLSVAYFSLLRTWIICAIDSHSMDHEHDLTWSQVNGMSWADEAVDVLERSVPFSPGWFAGAEDNNASTIPHFNLIAASCEVLEARIKGITSNRIIGWREEKSRFSNSLRSSGVLDILPPLLRLLGSRSAPPAKLNAVYTMTASLCCVLQELDLLRLALSATEFDVESFLKSMVVIQSSSSAVGRLCVTLLQATPKKDAQAWASYAVDTLSLLGPGDESHGMQIIDDLLDLAWPEEDIKATGHRHGFYILRPFLHYVVLPSLNSLIGPIPPIPKYLKLTKTLRLPPISARSAVTRMDALQTRRLGMPLTGDWLLTPIEELLKGTSSPAFKQLPPAWNATDLELARTSLIFLRLIQDHAKDVEGFSLHASEIFLALMKVFLLENRPAEVDDEGQPLNAREEIFRDDVVEREMRRLLDPYLQSNTPSGHSHITEPTSTSASNFYQLYESFIDLYDSVSFSHDIFGRLLLPPLAMTYPADHRRLFWVDHQRTVLRSIAANKFGFHDIPLETGKLDSYFSPPETDDDVLRGYVGAIVNGLVSPERGEFLFTLAVWHVAQAAWAPVGDALDTDPGQLKRGKDTLIGLFGSSSRLSPYLARRILTCPLKLTPALGWMDLASISISPEDVMGRLEVIRQVMGQEKMEVVKMAAGVA